MGDVTVGPMSVCSHAKRLVGGEVATKRREFANHGLQRSDSAVFYTVGSALRGGLRWIEVDWGGSRWIEVNLFWSKMPDLNVRLYVCLSVCLSSVYLLSTIYYLVCTQVDWLMQKIRWDKTECTIVPRSTILVDVSRCWSMSVNFGYCIKLVNSRPDPFNPSWVIKYIKRLEIEWRFRWWYNIWSF